MLKKVLICSFLLLVFGMMSPVSETRAQNEVKIGTIFPSPAPWPCSEMNLLRPRTWPGKW